MSVSQSTVVLCILGWTRSWPIMPVHSKIPICTFIFSHNPLLTLQMITKVNMYVYQKFGLNLTINMGDMAKSPFLQFFFLLSLFFFFSLNPSISKTVRGTCLKFCTQVGSDDPTCSNLSKCL